MSNALSKQLVGQDDTELSIYYTDFTPEAQIELLKAYRVTRPEEMNWDVAPVVVIEIDHIALGNSFLSKNDDEENECMKDEPGEHEGPDIRD